MATQRDLLFVSDLARMLGIGDEAVRALYRRGRLPLARIGRRLCIRRERFESWLDARTRIKEAVTRG